MGLEKYVSGPLYFNEYDRCIDGRNPVCANTGVSKIVDTREVMITSKIPTIPPNVLTKSLLTIITDTNPAAAKVVA